MYSIYHIANNRIYVPNSIILLYIIINFISFAWVPRSNMWKLNRYINKLYEMNNYTQ